MIPVCSAAQVRALDARTILGVGVPGPVLMENAGRLATQVLLERFPDACLRGVLILCGRGNNGGDGFVMARYLHMASVPVHVLTQAGQHSPDAALNRGICQRIGVPLGVPCSPEKYGVVVDALLGTGLSAPLRGVIADQVAAVNAAGRPVLAVDLPSGLHADHGTPLGEAIRAAVTVSFGRLKTGFFLEPGPDYVGDVVLADIGLDVAERWDGADAAGPDAPAAARGEITLRIPEAGDIEGWLPPRPAGAFKGTFGHLAVVAGSPEKSGAAVLCANAALRAGVGLVTLFVPREAWSRLSMLRPEVMVEDVDRLETALLGSSHRFAALAVGPGLGVIEGVARRVRHLWAEAPLPAVFDADGLNALVGHFAPSSHPRLITPHPGEAGRLLGRTSREVQADRLGTLHALANVAPTLLKGRYSLQSGDPPWVNPTGTVNLATAGTGDVLTGIIGALLARGLEPEKAGIVAAYWHGMAASGPLPMVAGDVVDALPGALRVPHVAVRRIGWSSSLAR